MASVLMAYGVVLAGLGFVVKNVAPTFGQVTYLAGLAGGGLCVLWGLAAVAGVTGRAWAVLSVIAAAVVLLSQAVSAWLTSQSEGDGSLTIRLLVPGMLLMTMGMLLYLLHGERSPEFYQVGPNRRNNPVSDSNEKSAREEHSKR